MEARVKTKDCGEFTLYYEVFGKDGRVDYRGALEQFYTVLEFEWLD